MKTLVLLLALVTASAGWADRAQLPDPSAQLPAILTDTFRYTLNTPSIIDIHELVAACPKRDCILSIDHPEFDSILNTDYLGDDDLLILVHHNGITRAYPHKILESREVVNDYFGRTPIVITYCPLCASGTAFVAQVGGLVTKFGVSGMLHNSDLVLYDRRTNQLWGQITGEAIVGKSAGEKLTRVPTRTVSWANVKKEYPRAQVLQPDLKAQAKLERSDGRSHYQQYAQSDRIKFPVSQRNGSLPPKQLIFGIELNDKTLAVTEKYLLDHIRFEHPVGGHMLQIKRLRDGSVTAFNVDTGEEIAVTRAYWFAWYAFHPNTELLQ